MRGRVEMRPRDAGPRRAAERRRARDAGAAREPDRPAARGGVPGDGAARRLRGARAGRAVLDQRNETFVPHVLAITAGTTVDFPNSDRTYHNVFSLSKAQRFDLGRYPPGHSKAGALRPAGRRARLLRHPLAHERVHPGLRHRYFAMTDADGRYRIDGVPPGTYTRGGLERGRGSARRARSRCPTAAAVEAGLRVQ